MSRSVCENRSDACLRKNRSFFSAAQGGRRKRRKPPCKIAFSAPAASDSDTFRNSVSPPFLRISNAKCHFPVAFCMHACIFAPMLMFFPHLPLVFGIMGKKEEEKGELIPSPPPFVFPYISLRNPFPRLFLPPSFLLPWNGTSLRYEERDEFTIHKRAHIRMLRHLSAAGRITTLSHPFRVDHNLFFYYFSVAISLHRAYVYT